MGTGSDNTTNTTEPAASHMDPSSPAYKSSLTLLQSAYALADAGKTKDALAIVMNMLVRDKAEHPLPVRCEGSYFALLVLKDETGENETGDQETGDKETGGKDFGQKETGDKETEEKEWEGKEDSGEGLDEMKVWVAEVCRALHGEMRMLEGKDGDMELYKQVEEDCKEVIEQAISI